MKKENIIFFIVSAAFMLFSCKTSFYTEKINADYEKQGIIYSLPETKIVINAEITKKVKQKGIFSEYTHLYFNTKNSIKSNKTEYYISNISVKTAPVFDSSQVYKIISAKNISPLLINLTKENFISGINLSDKQATDVNNNQTFSDKNEIKSNISDYADISLYSVREIQYDTIYKEILKDSVLVKVPVIRKKEVYKSTAKQAKETAQIIFDLRDDRYALLTGENDGNNFPDGKALDRMLAELEKLEKNYMSLFTGREFEIKKNYVFEIIPDKNKYSDTVNLFYFSNKKGVVGDTTANPVIMKITAEKNETKKQNSDKKGIIYRIPAKAEIKIIQNDKELLKSNVLISQFGYLNILPAELFKEKITVEFYPEYGSVKRISK